MTLRHVDDLVEGDMIDLQGDQWADPDDDDTALEFDLAIVEGVDVWPDRVHVYTNLVTFTAPMGHRVDRVGHMNDDGTYWREDES